MPGPSNLPRAIPEEPAGPKSPPVIHKMVLINFKSYARRQEIGPFQRVINIPTTHLYSNCLWRLQNISAKSVQEFFFFFNSLDYCATSKLPTKTHGRKTAYLLQCQPGSNITSRLFWYNLNHCSVKGVLVASFKARFSGYSIKDNGIKE